MIPPGHIPALSDLDDIPIHRESIGGMGLSTVSFDYRFKPYVYRGIGVDLYEHKAYLREQEAKAKAEHWEAERKAAALRERRRRRDQREAKRREQSEREETRQINSIPDLIAQMHAGINRALARADEMFKCDLTLPMPVETDEEPAPPRGRQWPSQRGKQRWAGIARPAQGWKPMTGEDIDNLLDELT